MADHILKLSTGLTLGYAEHGDPNGVPCFYFHGWPSARVQGVLMDEVGKKHGLRIISPDRPGIGLSDFQPKRTLLDWPSTLQELAAHVGAEKFHLLGWSGGGPYVLVTALKMPERVLSASVICGAPPLSFLGYQHMFWVYRMMIQLRHTFPPLLQGVLYLGRYMANSDPQKAPQSLLLRMLGKADREVLARPEIFSAVRQGMLESLRRGPKMVIADADIYLSEWGFEVSSVRPLIHFWHGRQDRNIAWQYSEQLAAIMPHTTTHWFDDEGHYSLPVNHADAILGHALGNS